MDRASAQAYLQRWQAVEAIEKMEALSDSLEIRWKQLNALYGLASALGILPLEDREEEEVRARWLQLKAGL